MIVAGDYVGFKVEDRVLGVGGGGVVSFVGDAHGKDARWGRRYGIDFMKIQERLITIVNSFHIYHYCIVYQIWFFLKLRHLPFLYNFFLLWL